MHLTVATAEKSVVDTDCQGVVLSTLTGQIEILPGHAHLLTQLEPGVMRVKTASHPDGQPYAIGSGFAQVDGEQVRVLTDIAARAEEIDPEAVRREIETLLEEVDEDGLTPEENAEHFHKISFARAKLRLVESGAAK